MARWKKFGSKKKIPPKIKKFLVKEIESLMFRGYNHKQAIAIAYSKARKKYPKYKDRLIK